MEVFEDSAKDIEGAIKVLRENRKDILQATTPLQKAAYYIYKMARQPVRRAS